MRHRRLRHGSPLQKGGERLGEASGRTLPMDGLDWDHGGSLVTLDRRLRPELVVGGMEALVVLDGP